MCVTHPPAPPTHTNIPTTLSGLNFFAFCAACTKLAGNIFYGKSKSEQLYQFLVHCEPRYARLKDRGQGSTRSKDDNDDNDDAMDDMMMTLSAGDGRSRLMTRRGQMSGSSGSGGSAAAGGYWPCVLEEGYEDKSAYLPSSGDHHNQRQHKNIFHLLQSLPR